MLCAIRVKNNTEDIWEKGEGGWLNVPLQESCSTRNCRCSRKLSEIQQSQTCIILHNVTQFTAICHSRADFQRGNYRVLQTQLVYLCSCFRPRERHSSECRCTPGKCWCTCCCGRRTCCPHRELKYKTQVTTNGAKSMSSSIKSIQFWILASLCTLWDRIFECMLYSAYRDFF